MGQRSLRHDDAHCTHLFGPKDVANNNRTHVQVAAVVGVGIAVAARVGVVGRVVVPVVVDGEVVLRVRPIVFVRGVV